MYNALFMDTANRVVKEWGRVGSGWMGAMWGKKGASVILSTIHIF